MTEDDMVEQHHRLDGHEFEQALGVGDGQGSVACCSPWSCKESDTTERLNCTECTLRYAVVKRHNYNTQKENQNQPEREDRLALKMIMVAEYIFDQQQQSSKYSFLICPKF